MTQEDKHLLLVDLCARLPYGVAIIPDGQLTPYRIVDIDFNKEAIVVMPKDKELIGIGCLGFEDFKLVLRPLSSMTEEEKNEYAMFFRAFSCSMYERESVERIDWLHAHHFDYRGLIEKGLALEAPDDMYK